MFETSQAISIVTLRHVHRFVSFDVDLKNILRRKSLCTVKSLSRGVIIIKVSIYFILKNEGEYSLLYICFSANHLLLQKLNY